MVSGGLLGPKIKATKKKLDGLGPPPRPKEEGVEQDAWGDAFSF